MKLTYKHTLRSCFIGYIVQAISVNFLPLLFVFFQDTYQISLGQLTTLITVHFGVQLFVDSTAPLYVDKLGYRPCIVAAHAFSATGLLLLTILPDLMDPFTGLATAVFVYGIGSGLIEVMISPITESCPTDNKEAAMQLLHSFYCWGHVGVVLISTLFFRWAGIQNWKLLSCIWAIIPIGNAIVFTRAPIAPLMEEGETSMPIRELLKNKIFWLFMVMMVCSGASEQAVSQWASAFAERGLGISKTMGDLAGPMAFAIFMGSARAFYGKFGEKMNLDRFMKGSLALCIFSYLLISLSPWPALSLVGCAICGLSVGILWPGTFSKAAATLRRGGTAMFALLALGGDLGCSGGPSLVGFVADRFGGELKSGILVAILFPVVLLLCLGKKQKQ